MSAAVTALPSLHFGVFAQPESGCGWRDFPVLGDGTFKATIHAHAHQALHYMAKYHARNCIGCPAVVELWWFLAYENGDAIALNIYRRNLDGSPIKLLLAVKTNIKARLQRQTRGRKCREADYSESGLVLMINVLQRLIIIFCRKASKFSTKPARNYDAIVLVSVD